MPATEEMQDSGKVVVAGKSRGGGSLPWYFEPSRRAARTPVPFSSVATCRIPEFSFRLRLGQTGSRFCFSFAGQFNRGGADLLVDRFHSTAVTTPRRVEHQEPRPSCKLFVDALTAKTFRVQRVRRQHGQV